MPQGLFADPQRPTRPGGRPVSRQRLPEPSTEPRANGLVGQVVRMLDRRGLYERIIGGTDPPKPWEVVGADARPSQAKAIGICRSAKWGLTECERSRIS